MIFVEINTIHNGTKEVRAVEPETKGLAVCRNIRNDGGLGNKWMIVHISSGKQVTTDLYNTKREACRIANGLNDLLDWENPEEVLWGNASLVRERILQLQAA